MSRSVEGIVEAHRLSRERIAAGLPSWAGRLRLADVFHSEEMTFEERRDAVVSRLRRSRWFLGSEEVQELADQLADSVDGDDFDYYFGLLYDEADRDRIWIETR